MIEWINNSAFKDKLHLQKNTGIDSIKKNEDGIFELIDSNQNTHYAKYVILCTGVMDVQPLINGSIDPILPYANVQLADYCLRCDGHHVLNKRISVIGHNSSTIWVAAMLFERYGCPEVSIVANGEKTSFDDETLALAKKYNFKIFESPIKTVIGNAKEKRLDGYELHSGEIVNCEYSFISLGMIVYNELAKMLNADLDNRGFVITDAKGKSTVDGLYVAGDLRANTKKQIYTAWDTAVDSADEINAILRRTKRNQAKI